MKIQILDFNQPEKAPKKVVLSLGCFDGIHLGHQKLIQTLLLEAKRHQSPSCLCVFDPPPIQVLQKKAFKRLFTIEEITEFLGPFGLDFFYIIPFSLSFSKLKAKEFIEFFLVPQFAPFKLVVGYDFSFAHQKQGDFTTLRKLSKLFNFDVKQVSAYLQKGKPVSSSRIKKHLLLADMQKVGDLLGRPFSIRGLVIRGHSRGKQLGFPTANLHVAQKELPPLGVYSGKVELKGASYTALINIGRQPTFGSESSLFIEAHILKFQSDLYGQYITVFLEKFLRKEKAFSNILELKQAIKQDIKTVVDTEESL